MSILYKSTGGRTPWHLWLVGVLSLLWNAFGAFDYLMTQTRNDAYMGNFSPEQLENFYSLPSWLVALWAIGVWGGVAGSLLLLLRKRASVWAFLASLLAVVVTTIYSYGFGDAMAVSGDTFSLIISAAVFVIAVLLLLYASAMNSRGILR